MEIQSINQNPISFQKLIIKRGSFDALKAAKYFPKEDYPNYHKNLLDFYIKLNVLKKKCENNNVYNVVIKPHYENMQYTGKIALEDSAGTEQCGFVHSFDEMVNLKFIDKKPYLTEKDEPLFLERLFKNWEIRKINKQRAKGNISMTDFLDFIYSRIEQVTRDADALKNWNEIKQQKK